MPAIDSIIEIPKPRATHRILGWKEWVSLPKLKVPRIKVKVDSGARTSALHAVNMEYFWKKKRRMVRFKIHPMQGTHESEVSAEGEVVAERWIRSSSGHLSKRPVIITRIKLGRISWPIELTLISRDVMGFRMLLGRRALANEWLIDPSRAYCVSARHPRKRPKGQT